MHQVSLRDSRSARNDRGWIEGVYRDYLNDLAPAATGIFPALGEIGHREPDQLMRWFADRTAQILTILYNEQPVGFAMVRRRLSPASTVGSALGAAAAAANAATSATASASVAASSAQVPAVAEFSMAEFFIARPWRRRGIGAQAVRLLFDRFDGHWLITEHLRNTGAVKFWRGVVAAYTRGKFQERIVNGEVHQRFESGPQRR